MIGLFSSKQPGPYLLLHPGMVFRNLGNARPIDQIGSAIAYICQVYPPAQNHRSDQRGPHTGLCWIGLRLFVDQFVGSPKGTYQACPHVMYRVTVVLAYDQLHSSSTGYLTSLMTTHTISHQVDSPLALKQVWIWRYKRIHIVFIMWANPAHICQLDSLQIQQAGTGLCRGFYDFLLLRNRILNFLIVHKHLS